jgi:transcription elongation factor
VTDVTDVTDDRATDGDDQRPSEIHPETTDAAFQAGRARDRETVPPAGQLTGASGGYGVGSDRSSGGSGDTPPPDDDENRTTTADDETEWLRSAPGGRDDPAEGPRSEPGAGRPGGGPVGSDEPVEGPRS